MQASAALYQCPNLNLQGYDIVTNKPRTEAYRGPGGIQAAFAMEQAMDALAQRLGMDPWSSASATPPSPAAPCRSARRSLPSA